ncbi:MAG: UDP-N-acetylmuramoyl-L-alanyl-D-glutamate--2,6-diaminopimelate ligase, partial [Clostridiales bacterium]
MRLSALLEGIKTGGLSADPQICGVTCDSRQVEKGYLFVAISGGQQDGHRFAGEALKRGAAAILAEHPPETGETAVITSDTRAAYTKI